jgi:hypothetical protein
VQDTGASAAMSAEDKPACLAAPTGCVQEHKDPLVIEFAVLVAFDVITLPSAKELLPSLASSPPRPSRERVRDHPRSLSASPRRQAA